MRRVSLHTRLVLTVCALVLVGLVPLAVATFGALNDWRAAHDTETLTDTSRTLAADLAQGGELTSTPLVTALATHGDVPSFFQLRRDDGTVLQTVSAGPVPPPTTAPGTVRVPGWLVHTEPVGADTVLVTGMRTSVSDELLARIRRVVILPSTLAFVGVLGLAVWLVRRELRPLARIARTAQAIGDGDLTQRVEPAGPRTEVGRLGYALNGMLNQLETAFEQRRASEQRLRGFLADAAHELRTPVATIRAYAELFRRGAADRPADLARVTARIESEAERMGVLVDEMLLLARLDQGRPLDLRACDLNDLAADAIAAARATDPDRPLELHTDGEPVILIGDATRLRQLLDNLLANVRAHTPSGTAATLTVRADGDAATVEVTDSGPGIPADDRPRVFDRFYRGAHTRTGGTGLGLSLVAAIAQAHDGTATAHPGPGGTGTCIRVQLSRRIVSS
ncbi:cell wall metabolism sensor histidine kinase WalK [Amycolatopsis sp. GM8]|uniref:sensor histidine kinase n=1 Tax=Amycolatopsis sp. GM8 TaxID=2896530 RepID=UPI001F182837|nr:HAMP domain-containing sensor histidine kinase [Amycolatopsis sp. GM8]